MHYFGCTLLHGGTKYKATGCGFVVCHEKFKDNYRIYSRSHFVVNSMKKSHKYKTLMRGASNNQTTKTKCMKVINTNKSKKQREKEREHT